MATETAPQGETHRQAGTPDYDVLIIGAGLSGIGVARYLEHEHPERRYLILEQRERIGGTWDLFRYPGIRSDSDLHTYGYAFRPWTDEKAIADGPAILEYIEATARDEHVAGKIRFSSHVLGADFSRHSSLWTLTVESPDGPQQLTCRWLVAAAGYFRYDHGYLPEFPGYDRFQGTLVHPQQWPQDLDYRGKRIVVIGSGATAVTLAPALATSAAHVTMLQRTPTYVISLPERDWLANVLKRLLPARRAYALTRRKNIWLQRTVYKLSRNHPKLLRRLLLRGVRRATAAGLSTSSATSHPTTTRGTSGCARSPTATCSSRSATAAPRWSPTGSRLHRARHPTGVRRDARGRHHRHRDRPGPDRARRDHVDGGRPGRSSYPKRWSTRARCSRTFRTSP